MRLIPALFIFVCCLLVTAQQPAEWERVYTFDDSTIDMNTALLSFVSEDVTRLRFRWIFDQPQSLSAEVEYKSRLEVMEFNCTRREARPYHITFLNAAGATVRIQDLPGKWRKVTPGSMTERLFEPACKLVNQKLNPPVIERDKLELQKAARYAFSIAQELESSKHFGTIISKFFASDYLSGYLQDDEHKWFHNLDQSTATNVNRNELQRFYIALMNTGYLSSMYVMSRLPSGSDTDPAFDKLFPPDVLRLMKSRS